MNRRNILIVEDDANDIKLMQASITGLDVNVDLHFMKNGSAALDYLFRKNSYKNREDPDPDLIILDLNIPLMNGFEVLQEIKKNKYLKLIPVVVFSSSNYDLDIDKCYNLGINSFVVKPMDFINYKKTVSHIINFWVDINQPPHL